MHQRHDDLSPLTAAVKAAPLAHREAAVAFTARMSAP